MDGYYYLHKDTKDLIYKPAICVDSDPQYFDSPFVQKVWRFDSSDRLDAWTICVEALAMGAKRERVFELKEKWGLTDLANDVNKVAEVAFQSGQQHARKLDLDDIIDLFIDKTVSK
jgi:hypothetical protein